MLCGSCIQHKKNSLKFKLLSFWRKYTPFIDQKCTYETVAKNLGRALPPPDLEKIQKNSSFFRDVVPKGIFPICRGPICQKVWGPICRQIGEGPICLEPSGWLWTDLKKDLMGRTWAQRDDLLCGCSPASRPTFHRFGLISQLWPDRNTHNSPDQLISELISKLVWAHWVFYLYWVAQVVHRHSWRECRENTTYEDKMLRKFANEDKPQVVQPCNDSTFVWCICGNGHADCIEVMTITSQFTSSRAEWKKSERKLFTLKRNNPWVSHNIFFRMMSWAKGKQAVDEVHEI